MSKLAEVTYNGDGSNRNFIIATASGDIPYLEQTHLQVSVDNVLKTIVDDYTINTSLNRIEFVTAPATGVNNVKIKRVTPRDENLVDWKNGGNIPENDLDNQVKQSFYIAQENIDAAQDAVKLPESETNPEENSILPEDRANKVLAFDLNKRPTGHAIGDIIAREGTVVEYATVGAMTSDTGINAYTTGQTIQLNGYYAFGDFGMAIFLRIEVTSAGSKSWPLSDGRYANLYVTGNGIINARWFGVSPSASATDNTTNLNLALNSAKHVYLPNGDYNFDGLVTVGQGEWLQGEDWFYTKLVATHADARIQASSNSKVTDIRLDGDDIGTHGLVAGTDDSSSSLHIERIRSENWLGFAIVANGTQNSTFLHCKAQNSKYCYGFINRVKNITCFGLTARGNSMAANADARALYFGNYSDSYLTTQASGPAGRGGLHFFGGIMEDMNGVDYLVENAASDDQAHVPIDFYGVELTQSGNVAVVKQSSPMSMRFDKSCNVNGDPQFDIDENYIVRCEGFIRAGGGHYYSNVGAGIVSERERGPVRANLLGYKDSIPTSALGNWEVNGSATISYNSTLKTFSLSGLTAEGSNGTTNSIRNSPLRFKDMASGIVNRPAIVRMHVRELNKSFGISINSGTDVITPSGTFVGGVDASSNLPNGTEVVYRTTGTADSGLTDGGTYYVITSTSTTFQVSATVGGAAINLSADGTGTETFEKVNSGLRLRFFHDDTVDYFTTIGDINNDGWVELPFYWDGKEFTLYITSNMNFAIGAEISSIEILTMQ